MKYRVSIATTLLLFSSACARLLHSPVPTPQKKPVPPEVTAACQIPVGINGSLKGFRFFPSNNEWNRDISSDRVDPGSSTFLNNYLGVPLHADWGGTLNGQVMNDYGIPYSVIDSKTPPVALNIFGYPAQSDSGPFPIPFFAPVEGGWSRVTRIYYQTDTSLLKNRHVLVLDPCGQKLYEFLQADTQNQGTSWNVSSSAEWDLTTNDLRPSGWISADGGGLPILPGLVRRDELLQGEIKHALRFTMSSILNHFVFPARHTSGNAIHDSMPQGARLRLKANFDVNTFSDGTPVPASIRPILVALKKYGMFLADLGGDFYLSGTSDPAWDPTELLSLGKIQATSFEVLSLPPAYQVTPPSALAFGTASGAFSVTLDPRDNHSSFYVTVSDGGAGGNFSPSNQLFLSDSSRVATFTYTPTTHGSRVFTFTSPDGRTDPSAISLNVP